MPIYEFQCSDPYCACVTEKITNDTSERIIVCPHCHQGMAFRIMSNPSFRVTGANAKNGYSSVPSYNEVIDEHGYAKKKWGN